MVQNKPLTNYCFECTIFAVTKCKISVNMTNFSTPSRPHTLTHIHTHTHIYIYIYIYIYINNIYIYIIIYIFQRCWEVFLSISIIVQIRQNTYHTAYRCLWKLGTQLHKLSRGKRTSLIESMISNNTQGSRLSKLEVPIFKFLVRRLLKLAHVKSQPWSWKGSEIIYSLHSLLST